MARQQRHDGPGTFHHVFNRGIARRTMFESRQDKRMFLALIARSVRRGDIRIHSFCLLSTHYHLLVESVVGRLDLAMQYVQTGYSRYFNRSRKRDGPLVRSRFASKCIENERYLNAVFDYIAWNPVQAGMAHESSEYEFSSSHETWTSRRWLTSSSIRRGRGHAPRPEHMEVIEARLLGSLRLDPLADLASMTPDAVLDWMRRKASLADGTAVGMPVCHIDDLSRAMEEISRPSRADTLSSRRRDDEQTLRAGLLRHLCGLRLREIGVILQRTTSTASAVLEDHERRMNEDGDYARGGHDRKARLVAWAVRRGMSN